MPALAHVASLSRSTLRGIKVYAAAHPVISGAAAIVVAVVLYWGWGSVAAAPAGTRYVIGNASTSTVVASISESGQVASSNTLTITPQVSGQILYVEVKPGQRVAQGALIAEIDPTQAQKTLRDAQANLASAQLSLQKLKEPATALSMAQAQNAVTSAQNALSGAYSQSAADLANTFLDMPSIMTGLADIDFGTETNKSQSWNIDWYQNGIATYDNSPTAAAGYRTAAYQAYQAAKTSYDQTFSDYQAANLASVDATTTQKLLKETYATLTLVQNATKAANALIQAYSDRLATQNLAQPAIAASQITTLAGYTSKLASHSSTLFDDSSSLTSGQQSLTEKELSLSQMEQGADTLDLATAELSVQKAQNAVDDARSTLAQYYVRAPFAGTIGSVSATAYAQASAGTALATLVTAQQYADLSVNEVDAAKLAVGDKATLTFDAISDLTLTGNVASIDQVGTVSQGVVSYSIKIGFDSQDPRIKPGMTVNAAIQTGVAQDVLTVPQAAVKTQNGQSYVLAFVPPIDQAVVDAAGAQGVATAQVPVEIPVMVGLSDGKLIEITSGLVAGQQVVAGSRSGTTVKATTSTTGAARGLGGGGGALRIGG